ncbi:MAG TPA: ribonuclease HII [Candidatus Levybacteria bacterium]|nr:ribonuclease HII [Candidatus Levybacteria bacterium]
MRTFPTLDIEKELWAQEYAVIGIDEVGRGAFAGPVYVSGVVFNPVLSPKETLRLETLGINDSKKLSPQKRLAISSVLQKENLIHTTSDVDSGTINEKGIMFALHSAVLQVTQELISKIPQKKVFILLDGTDNPYKDTNLSYNYRNIIKGDSLSLSIAAASIIAKVARDTYMTELALQFPHYFWDRNKGYGTPDHIKAIKTHGHCDQHRLLYLRKLNSTLTL